MAELMGVVLVGMVAVTIYGAWLAHEQGNAEVEAQRKRLHAVDGPADRGKLQSGRAG